MQPETLHVKLNVEEAVNSKRKLLSTEINLLNMKKKLADYIKIRSLELKAKTTLKTGLRAVIAKLEDIKKELPKTKEPEKAKVASLMRSSKTQLERELNEIREELKRLS